MSYRHPKLLKNGKDKKYDSRLTILTRKDKNNPTTGFCNSLNDKKAIDFDEVKRDFCKVRIQELKSVDAFIDSDDGKYYFIEFKKSTTSALNDLQFDGAKPIDSSTGLPVKCSCIELSLKQKAFDSLLIAAATVLQSTPLNNIMDNSVLIVVRLDDNASPSSLNKLAGAFAKLSSGSSVLWGLEDLKKQKLFSEVYTWTESEFESWAKNHL